MTAAAQPMTSAAPAKPLRRILDRAGMSLVFVLLFVGCCLFIPNFFGRVNLIGLALSVSQVGMVACTMLFCLAAGDFDLSVESVLALSGVLAAVVMAWTGSVAAGIAAGLAAGALVGLLNGVVISKLGINALITTLATMEIAHGLAFLVSGGPSVGITLGGFFRLGNTLLLGIPMPVWITAGCFIVFGVLLNKTTFGRATLAIGGNSEAARYSGIPVARIKIIIFTLQGLMAGFAGIIQASRFTSGQPNTAQGFALNVISACVLGGVSLTGGVGTIGGTLVGVLIMGTVQNAMDLRNVPTFYQYVVRGSILLAAVLFDRFRSRR
jgi:L-arabinose transport system permease protein